MMKVLLIQPPIEDFYTTSIRLYPLGLLYAARAFQQAGCSVGVLDCLSPLKKRKLPLPDFFRYLDPFLKENPLMFKGYYRFGMSDAETLRAIKSFAPDSVGISSQFTAYFKNVADLARLIHQEIKVPVFIGGNHATVFEAQIRKKTPEIDFVLPGPAEHGVCGFTSLLEGKSDPGAVSLDWKKFLPAHELLAGDRYKIGKRNYVSLTASRGCPYGCEFCSVHAMFGRQMDYRSVDHVLQEIRWNYEHKGARIFNFEDDNLSFDRAWFADLLTALIHDPLLREIELTAMNGLCHVTLDEDLLPLMYQAGFRQLNLAFVTRDANLRRQYQRPRHRRNFENLVAAAARLGFFITIYVIIGLPSQTYAEVKDSIDYLLGLGVLVGPSIFYLPPGSPLYPKLHVSDDILNNWNLYRSSAFAIETAHLARADLVDLFTYVRRKNLERKSGHD
ncbi:MAG: cobalamin-dependent protein [Desulfobacterales bacterium]|nr:cobalamin-dependent protein [Desulfobacterales bacterium]